MEWPITREAAYLEQSSNKERTRGQDKGHARGRSKEIGGTRSSLVVVRVRGRVRRRRLAARRRRCVLVAAAAAAAARRRARSGSLILVSETVLHLRQRNDIVGSARVRLDCVAVRQARSACTTRELLKVRVCDAVLGVRLSDVLAGRHGYDVLVRVLQLAVHLLEFAHGILIDLVSKHDRGLSAILGEDLLVVIVDGVCGLVAVRNDVPVVRILLPEDRTQTETSRNRTHAVVRVAERRTPARRSHTRHHFDRLGSVVQLGKHLLVRQRGHVTVRPGVYTNVVAIHKTALGLERPLDHISTDVEHRRLELVLLQVVVESVVRAVWAVVKRQTPSAGLRAGVDILRDVVVLGLLAAGCGPPAVRVALGVVTRVVYSVVWG